MTIFTKKTKSFYSYFKYQWLDKMKAKKPSMEELGKMIEEIHKDPELMEIAKKFVIRHGGRIPE